MQAGWTIWVKYEKPLRCVKIMREQSFIFEKDEAETQNEEQGDETVFLIDKITLREKLRKHGVIG